MDTKILFLLSLLFAIVIFYFIASKYIKKETRDGTIQIMNFMIPLFTCFSVLMVALSYVETREQSLKSRKQQFVYNNENRLATIIQSSKGVFDTNDESSAFYILTTIENAVLQRKLKNTSEDDVLWLNKIRLILKQNKNIITYWENNKSFFSPETNLWLQNEIENNFTPKFFPDQ
jgi:lysylphosphatidylglycerol synthetase-like protein (DUF2156 family)